MSDLPTDWHSRLCDALSIRSDLELLCSDGKAIKVHSLKLALASPVLGELVDVMEDQILDARKEQRTSSNQEGGASLLPQIKVGRSL